MTDFARLYRQNRRAQTGMACFAAALGLILATAPRNERALFMINGARPAAFTLAPLAPPEMFASSDIEYDGMGMPRRRLAGRRPLGVPTAFTPPVGIGGPAPIAPTSADVIPPSPLSPGGVVDPPSVVGPDPHSPLNPTVDPSPVGNRRDTPVPAVPEPAAWLLLITGFGLCGAALRRARRSFVSGAVAGPR